MYLTKKNVYNLHVISDTTKHVLTLCDNELTISRVYKDEKDFEKKKDPNFFVKYVTKNSQYKLIEKIHKDAVYNKNFVKTYYIDNDSGKFELNAFSEEILTNGKDIYSTIKIFDNKKLVVTVFDRNIFVTLMKDNIHIETLSLQETPSGGCRAINTNEKYTCEKIFSHIKKEVFIRHSNNCKTCEMINC